jgi:hypothetical protein
VIKARIIKVEGRTDLYEQFVQNNRISNTAILFESDHNVLDNLQTIRIHNINLADNLKFTSGQYL